MKKQFANGLFIRNDDKGCPCHVGDIVKVSVGQSKVLYNGWEGQFPHLLPPESFTGVLVLLKSKGVMIRLNYGAYVKPALTKNSIRKWKWELIKSN